MDDFISLALTLAPELGPWLFDDGAESTVVEVSQVVREATGTDDVAAAASKLQQDSSAAAKVRLRLAQIASERQRASRASDLDLLAERLRDTTEARAQVMSLLNQKTATTWSAPVISTVVLLTFGIIMVVVLRYGMPAGAETAVNMLLGTLAAMATSVVSYWVGSSAGSARKDDRLAQIGK